MLFKNKNSFLILGPVSEEDCGRRLISPVRVQIFRGFYMSTRRESLNKYCVCPGIPGVRVLVKAAVNPFRAVIPAVKLASDDPRSCVQF